RALGHTSLEALPVGNVVDLFSYVPDDEKIRFAMLEKSTDGLHYLPLETAGEGTTQSVLFKQTDPNPAEGLNYYRLRVFYLGGNQQWSPVRVVDFHAPDEWAIFPNPASDNLHIQWKTSLGKPANILVVNQLGQTIYEEVLPKIEDDIHTINTRQWHEGNYFVLISVDGRKPVGKTVSVLR
ncbi:MAG: T9SS C-terminal target domain-containing protein, partial [Bacteroidetes bacterium]